MASREKQTNGGREHPDRPVPFPLDQHFERDDLYALRAAVAAHAAHLGAPPERVRHLVIIASELASNAIRHGGGRGRLRLWRLDGAVRCEVSDEGPGMANPHHAGMVNPSAFAPGGRGLWVVRQLSDVLTIDSSIRGTTVTAMIAITVDPAGHS